MVAILLLSTLVTLAACGDDTTTTAKPSSTDDPTNPVTTTTSPNTNLDYPSQIVGMKDQIDDNTEIIFLYVEGGSGTYTGDSIWADSDDVDIDDVGRAVAERNDRIYDDLGVTITPLDSLVDISGLQDYAKTEFDAPTGMFDVYCGYQYFDISLATQGHLVNLNTIENAKGEKIIDINKPYWATDYINSITYNDYLYWVTGDLALRYTGGLYCTFVNTAIYDTYVKAVYDNKTIYNIVDEGNWTLDTMLAMAAEGYQEQTGDTVANEGDIIGIVYETCDVIDGMAFGCQIRFSNRVSGSNGDEITEDVDNDRAQMFASKLNTMYTAPYAYNAGNADSTLMMPIFANGEALFAVNKINMATVYLSEMVDEYAIVPTPKLNTAQTEYASGVHDSLTIFGISKYSEKIEAAAATLELMAYYGQKVSNTYYEKVLTSGKTIRDDDARRMIDVIRAGFDTDFVAAWSASVDNVIHLYRTPNNVKSFSAYLRINSRQWPSMLEKLLTDLEQVANEDIV